VLPEPTGLVRSRYRHNGHLRAIQGPGGSTGRRLQQAGIQAGDRIGVVGKNSLAFFQIYGAAAALGAIVLPINWRLSADEVAFNLNDCTPAMVFVDDEFSPMVTSIRDQLDSVQRNFNLTDCRPL
jgi:acyl-CoA synthetase (AMP-forming)/AMP-acid ligase II